MDIEIAGILEDFLLNRPEKHDLVVKHILKDYDVAPSLLHATEKLLWEKKARMLQRKIEQRPDMSQLIEKGIMQDSSKHGYYEEIMDRLEKKVGNRPEIAHLIERRIMRSNASPTIYKAAEKIDKETQKGFLSSHLRTRPKPEEVVQRFGIKNEMWPAPCPSTSSASSSPSSSSSTHVPTSSSSSASSSPKITELSPHDEDNGDSLVIQCSPPSSPFSYSSYL